MELVERSEIFKFSLRSQNPDQQMINSQLTDFTTALQASAESYGVTLDAESLAGLSSYYELLNSWNAATSFNCANIASGICHASHSGIAGAYQLFGCKRARCGCRLRRGLPILPCLIVRPDITATLIESSKKKALFLREAMNHLKLSDRATVIAERFEDVASPDVEFVTCRAIERFEQVLPSLIDWAPPSATLLMFGGEGLQTPLANSGLTIQADLLPNSERRFLFVARKR